MPDQEQRKLTRKRVPKDYAGDGIYMDDLGYTMRVTTENGISVQNTIHIEPLMLKAINNYAKRMWGEDWDA